MGELLSDICIITVETDEENPVILAIITQKEVIVADGYRVRLKPEFD